MTPVQLDAWLRERFTQGRFLTWSVYSKGGTTCVTAEGWDHRVRRLMGSLLGTFGAEPEDCPHLSTRFTTTWYSELPRQEARRTTVRIKEAGQ